MTAAPSSPEGPEWTVVRRGGSPLGAAAVEMRSASSQSGGRFDALAEGRRGVRFSTPLAVVVGVGSPPERGGRNADWTAGLQACEDARRLGLSARELAAASYAEAEADCELESAEAVVGASLSAVSESRAGCSAADVLGVERSGAEARRPTPSAQRCASPQTERGRKREGAKRVPARRPLAEPELPRPSPPPRGRRRPRSEISCGGASASPSEVELERGVQTSGAVAGALTPAAQRSLVHTAIQKVEGDVLAAERAQTTKGPNEPVDVRERRAAALLFWSHRADRVGERACLSNWAPCDFVLDGVRYSSSEQALMVAKAKLFGSESSVARILAVPPSSAGAASDAHGRSVQELGRLVPDFDPELWDECAESIVVQVLLAKFGQSPALRSYLLSTGSRWLVEASPWDAVWGIGVDAQSAAALSDDEFSRRCREGNRLGRVLMAVRSLLRAEGVRAQAEEALLAERVETLAEAGLRGDGVEGGSQCSQGHDSSARSGGETVHAAGGGKLYDDVERLAALALERRAQREGGGLGAAETGPEGGDDSSGGELAVPLVLRQASLLGAGHAERASVSEELVAAVFEKISSDDVLSETLLATGLCRLASSDGSAYVAALESARARLRHEGVEACDAAELARRNAAKKSNLLPGAPRGLPACFAIDWRTLVSDAWALYERGEFDDVGIILELAAFNETGGFRAFGRPLERDEFGPTGDPLHVNAAMDLGMLKTLYSTLATEVSKGWLNQYGSERSSVPYRFMRLQPMFFVPKGDGEGGQKVSLVVDPSDGVEKPTLRWRLCEDAKRSGLNADTPMGYVLKRGTPGQLDDVRDAAEKLMALKRRFGKDVEMSLVDESGAYRNYAVSDLDRPQFGLFGIDVSKPFPAVEDLEIDVKGIVHLRADQCCFYVSSVLRFGWARSVEWYWRSARLLKALHLSPGTPLETYVPRHAHDLARYLDDSLVLAVEGWGAAAKQRLLELMVRYNVPYSVEKDERDGKVEFTKQFLGVVIDGLNEEMRISAARLDKMLGKLNDAKDRSFMLRSEFASLVGLLSFAASCAPASRTFMKRMFRALRVSHGRFLRLDRGLKADLAFWIRFAPTQNGKSLMLEAEWSEAEELRFWTDASLDGYGAAFQLPSGAWEYFGGLWSEFGVDTSEMHISQLEMLAAAMAFDTWGSHLSKRRVITRCDNESSVYTINALSSGKGATTDAGMLVVAREIFFICAKHSFMTRSRHIGTKLNVLADAASRADWKRFFEFAKSEFGVDKAQMRRVEPTLDTREMLLKIRKAMATERRMAEEKRRAAAQRRGSGRRE